MPLATRFGVGFSLALALAAATGCSTIFDHRSESFSLQSIPDGASYTLEKSGTGGPIARGETPASLHLRRGDGYFEPAKYVVHVWKDGYEPATVEIPTSINASYWANILMTPLLTPWPVVAMLIVDPITGAMWKIDPPTAITLQKKPKEPESASELPPHE
ncbi:MAG TPA: hypothetical protein VEI82_12190 [Myxococcota bacterium]|nr:hypothetical protein [Myxococcota bacterium]